MPFFIMDKKKTPLVIKIFAGVIAVSFILGVIWFTIAPFASTGSILQAQPEISPEEQAYATDARMYESMTSINTTDTTAWVSLGNTYMDWGFYLATQKNDDEGAFEKFKKAEEAYRAALELNPDDELVKTDLAAVLYYTNQLDEARSLLDEVLDKNPKMPQALFNAGLVARAQGDYEAAIVYLEKFLEYYPDDPNAQTVMQLISEMQSQAPQVTTRTP